MKKPNLQMNFRVLNAPLGTACLLYIVSLLVAALILSSCAARTNQFRQFSQAGIAYVDAVTIVLNEAGTAAIDTDSMVLVMDRPDLPREDRQAAILEHNKLLRERLQLLGDLKRHARLLGAYFEALAALAEDGRSPGIGQATEGVVSALGKLRPTIENAKVGGVSVSSLVGNVVQIAVSRFKAKALEDELKKRAQTIERELDLQEAALTAVAQQMRTDLQAQLQQQESIDVVLPYVANEPLPAGWAERRRGLLKARIALASVDAAADAARNLKVGFVALAEGRSHVVDISTLSSAMSELRALIEHAQEKEKEN